jgi:hypothetical protein
MGEAAEEAGGAMPLYQEVRMLGKKGEYAHAILLSWGFVESVIDLAVRDEFDVPDIVDVYEQEDIIPGIIAREHFLTETPFIKKLAFLKETEYLTKPEWKAIDKFRGHRNRIFHKYFDSPLSNWTAPETRQKDREAIIDMAVKAVEAVGEAMTRRNREKIARIQESKSV